MRRILKFTVHAGITTVTTADVPRWLAVGVQGDQVVAWCEATVGEGVTTLLGAVMTGESVTEGDYIGTAQVGAIVVHVYQKVA